MYSEIDTDLSSNFESEDETNKEEMSENNSNREDEDLEGNNISENPMGFENIKEVLGMCSPPLTEYFPRFEEAMVVNGSIKTLTLYSATQLFKKEVGLQGIFMDGLKKFLIMNQPETLENVEEYQAFRSQTEDTNHKKSMQSRCLSGFFPFSTLKMVSYVML